MIKKYFIALSILFLFGCSNTVTDGKADRDVKTFRGEYLMNNDAGNIGTRRTDSVLLTVSNNDTYELRFFDVSEGETDFCNHSGFIDDFWTNRVTFSINLIDYNNCDTLNIPKRTYMADFQTLGDTILLEQQSGDTLRRITLLK